MLRDREPDCEPDPQDELFAFSEMSCGYGECSEVYTVGDTLKIELYWWGQVFTDPHGLDDDPWNDFTPRMIKQGEEDQYLIKVRLWGSCGGGCKAVYDSAWDPYYVDGNEQTPGYIPVELIWPEGYNYPPTVNISSPENGSTFNSGSGISFKGTATDTEDGDLSSGLTWISSIDGEVGVGGTGTFSELSKGSHAISAEVIDSGDKSSSDTITIVVDDTVPALQVDTWPEKDSYRNRQYAGIFVEVTYGTDPVEGARVDIEIISPPPKNNTYRQNRTTDAFGMVYFMHKVNSGRDGVGTYTVNATASKDGFTDGSGSTTFEVTE